MKQTIRQQTIECERFHQNNKQDINEENRINDYL